MPVIIAFVFVYPSLFYLQWYYFKSLFLFIYLVIFYFYFFSLSFVLYPPCHLSSHCAIVYPKVDALYFCCSPHFFSVI